MSIVRPYGDTTGDGMVQLSFTLPMPHDKRAEGAAVQLANKMGIDPALVVHAKPMGPDFTFFVVYGPVNHLVDTSKVEVLERDYPLLRPKEANLAIRKGLRRRLTVVGACIGTDAHTVGIDAILNVKGFAGEKGLEYYRELKVVNLGAQVAVPELVRRARQEKADAILVSQVVTQREAHVLNTKEMSAAFREAYSRARPAAVGCRRPPFHRADGRRARRRPGVRPRYHAGRGGQLPGRRAGDETHTHRAGSRAHDERRRSVCTVTHRRYVPYSHAHYAGHLVDGAYVLGLFGDVATEVCIQHRRRRGPVRVVLRRPVLRAAAGRGRGRGDRDGHPGRHPQPRSGARSRTVVCRGRPDLSESAAEVLAEPLR